MIGSDRRPRDPAPPAISPSAPFSVGERVFIMDREVVGIIRRVFTDRQQRQVSATLELEAPIKGCRWSASRVDNLARIH